MSKLGVGLVTMAMMLGGSLAAATPETWHRGTVHVVRGMPEPSVRLHSDSDKWELSGPLAGELGQLQSATVKVRGAPKNGRLRAKAYKILDVGGGIRPLVGHVAVQEGHLVVERDGADPLRLQVTPRGSRRLRGLAGAKIWVYGNRDTDSAPLKVMRYGVLKPPPKSEDNQAQNASD